MTQTSLAKVDFSAIQSFVSQDELQEINSKFSGGITGGSWLPEIRYKGNRWSLKIGDEPQFLGTDHIQVYIVDARPTLSKTFYRSGYVSGSDAKPDCSSTDALVPDSHIASPESDNCQLCPHNAWGSKVSETSSKGKACQDYKQIVVVFAAKPDKPFALRVPPASLKAYRAYISQLSMNKVPAFAAVTQISLDPKSEYPDLSFICTGIVSSREEFNALKELQELDDVRAVVQIQPRTTPAALPEPAKTAEQPVVVPEPKAEDPAAPAVDLRSILEGNKTDKPKTTRKKKAADVIEESTSDPVSEIKDVAPGVVSSLDELLSRI